MQVNPEIIRQVYVQNSLNGQKAVLHFIEGLSSLDCLNSLSLQGCTLNVESIGELIRLFPLIYPSNLEELRIIDCVMDHDAKSLLLQAL